MKKNLSILLLVLALQAASQNECKRWFFGNYAGLNFMTNPPTIVTTGAMNVDEGCTSVCDANGNLLFYGFGMIVFNKYNAVMANGTGVGGHSSSSQGALAIKKPGSQNIYYYFTLDAQNAFGNGMRYSIIDLSLAGGAGSVTVKGATLTTDCTEKMSAVKHCNGVDVWIMTHDWNSDGFRAYLLTAAGVNTVPVITNIGPVHSGPTTMMQGCLKFSPGGNKMAHVVNTPGNYGSIELYDFDRATGIVSNSLVLNNSVFQPYGCEFSPDGTKLYAGGWYTPLYQWNVCAGTNSAIVASQYSVAATQLTGMQMAPNGKVYVCRAYQQMLGVINNPNAAGALCAYSDQGQSTAPKSMNFNLPNFVTSFFDQNAGPPAANPFTYTATCNSANFSVIPPAPVVSCTSPSYSLTNVRWYFGDPGSGSADTSLLLNPSHVYSAPGTYTVKLIQFRCKIDTLIQIVNIGGTLPTVSVNGKNKICAGESTSLTASGANTYSWSNNTNGTSVVISPTVNTNYTVTGTNTLTGCKNSTVVSITVTKCTSLNEAGEQSVFNLFYREQQQDLRIENKQSLRISITAINGAIIIKDMQLNEGTHNIDLSAQPPGIYIVNTKSSLGSGSMRIVKKE